MSQQAPAPNAPNAQNPADMTQPIFSIEKIYVKDMSLEVPAAPKIFLQNEQPQVEVNVHTGANVVEQGALYEVVLTITVTAKAKDHTVFLVEVAQAGLFHIRNLPPQDLDAEESVLGAMMLSAEAIADVVAVAETQLGLDGVAAENLQARMRGVILMGLSNAEGHLTLTTGNKTELAVGYSTIYGSADSSAFQQVRGGTTYGGDSPGGRGKVHPLR